MFVAVVSYSRSLRGEAMRVLGKEYCECRVWDTIEIEIGVSRRICKNEGEYRFYGCLGGYRYGNELNRIPKNN